MGKKRTIWKDVCICPRLRVMVEMKSHWVLAAWNCSN